MSHKRPSKRRRSSFGEAQSQFSPSNEHFKPKRSKFEEHADPEESSVRRSSRAPKPKLFDDEYLDSHSSSFDDNESRGKKERAVSPTKQSNNPVLYNASLSALGHDISSDFSRRKSSRPPKPKVYDEDFIDSPRNKVESKPAGKEIETKVDESYVNKITPKQQQTSSHKKKEEKKEKSTNKNSQKDKPVLINTKDKQIIPKGNQKTKKSASKILNYYADSPLQESVSYAGEQLPGYNKDELSKVRHSSRTPKPKKTFTLIEDSSFVDSSRDNSDVEVTSNEFISSESITLKSTSKSKKHSHKADFLSRGESGRFDNAGEFQTMPASDHVRPNETSKLDTSDKKSKKKSKKTMPDILECTQDVVVDVIGIESKEKEEKTNGKEKKKSSTKSKEVSKDDGKKKLNIEESKPDKAKAKKMLKKVEKPELSGGEIESPPVKASLKHSSNENSKKTHSKHTKTKQDRPLCETKDEDKHIILKLHLPPHSESSSHSHSHKKHKHKHHTIESKTERSSCDGKAKKRKLSMDACSSSEETRKKVSIKFKGLSSSEPDVEVGVESHFCVQSSGKVVKEPEVKKKKSKKHSHGETTHSIPTAEQEHVKVIIKKSKKEIRIAEGENEEKLGDNTTQAKDLKSKPKEPKILSKESEQKKPKSSPKKKSKGGSTPAKSSNDKEKKKIVTGYLLFCKNKRSQIAEANPGLDFPQISQKVGEAWNNLSDEEKQKWKDKANNIKAKLNINTVEKKQEKKIEGIKSGPDIVDMAAHLKLLGESLSLIGASLMAQRGTEVHGSLSVLLDSILCAICPLTFLTSHIPGIPGVAKEKQVRILDDLAYTMPGLG